MNIKCDSKETYSKYLQNNLIRVNNSVNSLKTLKSVYFNGMIHFVLDCEEHKRKDQSLINQREEMTRRINFRPSIRRHKILLHVDKYDQC